MGKQKALRDVPKLTMSEKATVIEEDMFEAGRAAYSAYKLTPSVALGRLTIGFYRTCLQAMRDKVRYHANN